MGQGTGPLCTAGGSPGWVRHWEQSDLCRGQRPAAITNAGSRNSVGFVRHKQKSTKRPRAPRAPRTPRQIVALRVGLLTSRKVAKPLQIHSVGRVRTAERSSFEGTLSGTTTTQKECDGRRKTKRGDFGGAGGLPPCPSESGELSADSRGKAPLDLVRSVA